MIFELWIWTKRRVISVAAACIVLCLDAGPISAYICGSTSPPPTMCQVTASYDAIFLGKAVATSETFKEVGPGFGLSIAHVKLRVLERFRGLRSGVRTVNLEYRLAPESAHFVQGVTYIVYAHKSKDGRLSVSGCSPTRPSVQAQADIGYFRRSAKSKAPCSN